MWSLGTMLVCSGGQTGVDRGALIGAALQGIKHGGWCPKGRKAEDGVIPLEYPLTEAHSDRYEDRTRLNVECADATLILTYEDEPTGGTKLTVDCVKSVNEALRASGGVLHACMILTLERAANDALDKAVAQRIREWLTKVQPKTLNVAGPRESKAPGVKDHTAHIISLVFQTRARCVCGRPFPKEVWEKPAVLAGASPLRCSKCGHDTYAADVQGVQ